MGFAVALAAAFLLPAAGWTAERPAVLDEIAASVASGAGAAVRFEQVVSQPSFGREVTAQGEIVWRKGSLYWQYDWPNPQTYIVDGKEIHWVQPDQRQVVSLPLGQAFETHHAVAALLGDPGALDRYFKIESVADEQNQVTLELKPRFDNAQLVHATLMFDRAGKVIRMIAIRDAFGNVNTIRMHRGGTRLKPSSDLFDLSRWAEWKQLRPGGTDG